MRGDHGIVNPDEISKFAEFVLKRHRIPELIGYGHNL